MDIKKVVVIKWMEEISGGIRNVCKECREWLGKEIRVIRKDGTIKLNGRIFLYDDKHNKWIDVTPPEKYPQEREEWKRLRKKQQNDFGIWG